MLHISFFLTLELKIMKMIFNFKIIVKKKLEPLQIKKLLK